MSKLNVEGCPPAIVIGLCVHGLAIARCLHKEGVKVYALESDPKLPGNNTSCATVFDVASINSVELIDSLVALRTSFKTEGDLKPVLFPINDNAVKVLAAEWGRLEAFYELSWSDSIAVVLRLLDKGNLERYCDSVGVGYPASVEVQSADALRSALDVIDFPAIVKPTHPLSRFKARKLFSTADVDRHIDQYPDEYPLLVQPWIPGDDKSIYFCAFYLREGEVLAQFVGQKLRSHPPAMGQTTAAIPVDLPDVAEQARAFFKGVSISGPVSLELKRSPEGKLFVIEPTVGRTDYWADVCIQNGVPIPWIEYCDVIGCSISESTQSFKSIWLDSERDPLIFWSAWRSHGGLSYIAHRFRFAFQDRIDLKPFIHALRRFAWKRVKRSFGLDEVAPTVLHAGDDIICQDFDTYRSEGDSTQSQPFFESVDWFETLYRRTFLRHERMSLVSLGAGRSKATIPLLQSRGRRGARCSYVANYYSPYVDLITDHKSHESSEHGIQLIDRLPRILAGFDSAWISPLRKDSDVYQAHLNAFKASKWITQPFFVAGNWYQDTKGVSYAEYFTSRPTKLRSTVTRKSKQFAKAGGNLVICTDVDCMDECLQAFEHIYTHSWKTVEPYPEFIRDMVYVAAGRKEMRFGVAYLQGVPVAAQIWVVSQGIASIYKLAYDLNYKRYSPGTVLTAELFRRAIDIDNVDMVDFLNGDEPFKKDWMDNRGELWGVVAYNPMNWRGLLWGLSNSLAHWFSSRYRLLTQSRY